MLCRRTLFILWMLLGLASWSGATVAPVHAKLKVHLIVAADGRGFAGNNALRVDADGINFTSTIISQIPAGHLNTTSLGGGKIITKMELLNAITNAPVERDDVLLFYYSGHGAIAPMQGHYLSLSSKEALLRSELSETLKAKGARLTLVITDCCSAFAPLPDVPRPDVPVMAAEKWSPLCEKLMKGVQGHIDITSSSPGEFSWISTKDFGSIFTVCLTRNIHEQQQQILTWKELFRVTRDATILQSKAEAELQTPELLKYEVSDWIRFGVEARSVDGGGVHINRVIPGTAAVRARLEPGDVIVRWDGIAIEGAQHFSQLVDKSKGDVELMVRNMNTGLLQSVTITLP